MNILLVTLISFLSCSKDTPTQFSQDALNDTFVTLSGETIPFNEILTKHKDKTILIDVWASWCKDCIKGMPKVKTLQENNTDVVYVFLSLDKSMDSWKRGIDKYQVEGDHYFMQSGWKGDFGTFIDLDWIPRYMVVDETGTIKLFKAVKADDSKLINALK
ncbi:thioredoxin family protein [Gaetbulibacter jejuensis]|uniref:TlpA family protein disulfide reductase n=1 Tax=Gaetbulibacter jejuensis TaxID=584607 RepID=UPI003009407C